MSSVRCYPGCAAGLAVLPDVADSTVRYRAESRFTYAAALFELVMYARSHSDDFAFGPLDLGSLERNGLTISGPDLAAVRKMLAKVPGLTEEVP